LWIQILAAAGHHLQFPLFNSRAKRVRIQRICKLAEGEDQVREILEAM